MRSLALQTTAGIIEDFMDLFSSLRKVVDSTVLADYATSAFANIWTDEEREAQVLILSDASARIERIY